MPLIASAYHQSRSHPSSTLISHQEDRKKPNARENAFLAKAAYEGSPVAGYTIDPELSDKFVTTYRNNQTGKATLAFAGTTVSKKDLKRSARDIMADKDIFYGQEEQNQDFNHALQIGKKAIAKYGHDNVFTTGHSLGATKGAYVSSKLGVEGTGYGMGWSPLDILNHSSAWSKNKWDMSKFKSYAVPGDLVSQSSFLDPTQNVTAIPKPEKLKKVKEVFANKPMEAAAGTSLTSAVAGIPVVGEVAAAGLTAYGGYKLGSALYGLHKADNFTIGRGPKDVVIPTMEDSRPSQHDAIPLRPADRGVGKQPKRQDVFVGKGPVGLNKENVMTSPHATLPLNVDPFPIGTFHPYYAQSHGYRARSPQHHHPRKGRRGRKQAPASALSRQLQVSQRRNHV